MPGFALDSLVTLPDKDFTSIYLISLSLFFFVDFLGVCDGARTGPVPGRPLLK